MRARANVTIVVYSWLSLLAAICYPLLNNAPEYILNDLVTDLFIYRHRRVISLFDTGGGPTFNNAELCRAIIVKKAPNCQKAGKSQSSARRVFIQYIDP